ncbi:MAG: hypothetical protein KI790_11405 [Cyclobacteriaceae bacterium]|nr:hypothetical protein [Cyclobacteriaceae bacterium HetDA_MAG_MS6]
MSIIHSNALPPTSVMTIPSGLMITGNVIPNVQKLWDITQTIEGLSNNGISTIERIPTTIAYQSAGAIDISSVITIFGNVTQGSSVQLDIGNLNLGVQSYIIPPIQANGTWSYPVNTQFLNPKWAGNIYYRVQNGISVQYVRYNVTTSKQFFIDVNELPADCILSRF